MMLVGKDDILLYSGLRGEGGNDKFYFDHNIYFFTKTGSFLQRLKCFVGNWQLLN